MNFEFYLNKDKEWIWHVVSFSGLPVTRAVTTYETREACIKAIEAFKDDLTHARILDKEEDRWL